jgi:hypothetical protein
VPGVIAGEVSTNEPYTRSIVFTRAATQVVGDSRDTWTAGVWSDTPLQPGELLSARVRLDNGPIGQTGCQSLCFIHTQPAKVGTSSSLGWFFGGTWRGDFGEREAEAATTQLQANIADRPLALTAGKPLELFSVTNDSGHVLSGYVEFTRYVPAPAASAGKGLPRPQAILHVRRFAAYLPSMNYTVKLPPGYGWQATVNMGQATTHFAPSPTGGDYFSSWIIPPGFRRASSPDDYRDLPAQMSAQRASLEARFQELQDLGPIPVVLGESFTVFCLTNKAGEVYRACFELSAPSSATATNELVVGRPAPALAPPVTRVPPGPPTYLTPQNRRPEAGPITPGRSPAPARIDPATGLPVSSASAATVIDPATGLPVSRPPAVPAQLSRTNGAIKPTRN